MERAEFIDGVAIAAPPPAEKRRLLRILGVGFGLAVGIGGTIGVGILRNPSGVGEQIPSAWLIMLAWTLGGVYCLLGANYLAELATMVPKAGGFYVYAHRAFGDYGGFVVGWSDWINQTLGISFISIVFGEYAARLLAPDLAGGRIIFSISIVIAITILNLAGLRAGSETQKITSFLKAVALVAFVVACFIFGGQKDAAVITSVVPPAGLSTQLLAFILAFQLVLGTYDGWYAPIYFTEEDTNPKQNLPRSMFGGIAAIIVIYLLVNIALLYVLPMSQLAVSEFAGGDAMNLMFGARSGQIVTVLALLSLIGIINAIMMMAPRIMFALGRDGLFTKKAAAISKGGTPVFALIATALCVIVLSSVGTFELLLAVGQFFLVVITILLIASLFVLRRREPDLPRPFRACGYPYLPGLMLIFSVLLFFGYIVSNPFPSLYALAVLALSYPIFRVIRKAPQSPAP
jgi:basic amino acid/polyamine antiporter, APA family